MKRENRNGFFKNNNASEKRNKIVLYFMLVIGSLTFSMPFYWLVVTSFKSSKEIVQPTPSWIPQIPGSVSKSPYLSANLKISKPQNVDEKEWGNNLPELEKFVWTKIKEYEDTTSTRFILNHGHSDSTWQTQMQVIAGKQWPAWKKLMTNAVLKNAMPIQNVDASENMPIEKIIGSVMSRVTPKEIKNSLEENYHSFALGRLVARNKEKLDYNIYNLSPDEGTNWKFDNNSLGPFSMLILEQDSAFEVPYRFSDISESDTMQISSMLPFSTEMLERITLAVHSDGSFNNINVLIQTKSGVYKSTSDFTLDDNTWKDAIWRFGARQRSDILPSILLKKELDVKSSITKPGEIRLTLIISKTSHLQAIYRKLVANYKRLIDYLPFLTYLKNTIILLLLNIFAEVFAASFVAYGFSRVQWPGRNLVFVLVLATMMLPGQVTMIPQFLIWKGLGMYNTWQPLWLPALFGSAFDIFLLRQFFMTLPKELEDAARVDGCGYFRTYWKIMLPQLKPALATIAIFQFMGTWNNFMGPLIYISSDKLSPLALGLFTLQTVHASDWGMLMAASVLMAIPTILIFLFMQKYFIKGITFTGTKG